MNSLAQLGSQTKEFWGKLDKKIKWLAIILTALVFIILIGITFLNKGEKLAPLFYDLEPADAGRIISMLEEDKITYKLQNDGRTILVPADKVDSLRITLAATGKVTGGVVGYEIFDQTKWGITDFEQKQRYKRALEGELVRSIRTLEEVRDVRVHVVLPEPSPFIREESLATASVVLTLEPYTKISADRIKGIANFMAGAIPGLLPENVTIMDSSWNILSDPAMFKNLGYNQTTQPTDQIELKKATERELELRLQSMLERVFGFGKAVVRVSGDLAFDYKETKAEIYEPVNGSKGIIRSEQQTKESQTGSSSQLPIGVPGVTSNIPGYQIANNTEDNSTYDRTESVTNYEVSKRLEHHVAAPGTISRLSVAVWLNGDLDETTKNKVREVVIAAAGLNFDRGDHLTVDSLPFASLDDVTDVAPTTTGTEDLKQLVYLAAGILALIIVAVVYLRRQARKKKEQKAVLEMAAVSEVEQAIENTIKPEDAAKMNLEKEVKILARQKPEEVAKVLQTWLNEE